MNPPPPLRWGILGCARITRRGLIPGIAKSNGSKLVALASRGGATARLWAEEFGIPRACSSYEEVVTDPEIDAVYIPLPNELHKEWVEKAADNGKHILCEKPLAIDASEAEAMVAYCKTRGVVLMEAFMWPHQPRVAELLREVSAGLIGELRLIRASFSFNIDMNDWRLDPSRGGGALWDVGCYGVSTARLFAGGDEPSEIRASAHFGSTGVDLSLAATLRFPNDVLAHVDCSFEQPFCCSYELVGSKATITVPDAYLPPEHPVALLRLDGATSTRTMTFDGRDQYACMVDHFARSVAAGTLLRPGEDGLAQMKALDAVLAAARS